MITDIANLRTAASRDIRREAAKGNIEKEILVHHLVEPHLTFHGTRKDLIPLVVREGFRVPKPEGVRCGSTYGQSMQIANDYSAQYSNLCPNDDIGRGIYTSLVYTGYSANPRRQ